MKKIILMMVVLCSISAKAQQIELADFKGLVSSTRMGTFFPIGLKPMGTVYTPALSIHDSTGVELVNVNGGLVYEFNTTQGSPMGSFGVRLDSIIDKVGATEWFKIHASFIKLPPTEVSMGGAWFVDRIVWGGGFAWRFK